MNQNNENIIQIKNIKFKYVGSKTNEFNLNIPKLNIKKGEWTTILGPNGSGKSTLAKVIVKINKLKKGEIILSNLNIKKYKPKQFAQKISYIPQIIEIPMGTSIYDFVSFGRNPYLGFIGRLTKKDKKVIQKAMEATGTIKWKDKMMDELSGGQRQKILIAMIIAQDAEIIMLDEPTTYLDIRNQYELLDLMKKEHLKNKTIITILHDINQSVQFSDTIHILKNGKIYSSGTPKQVITTQILADVYGVKTKLYEDHSGRRYLTDIHLI